MNWIENKFQTSGCLCYQAVGLVEEVVNSRTLSLSHRLSTQWNRWYCCCQQLEAGVNLQLHWIRCGAIALHQSRQHCVSGHGGCWQAWTVGFLLLLSCQRLCKCSWHGWYLSWRAQDGSLSGELWILKTFLKSIFKAKTAGTVDQYSAKVKGLLEDYQVWFHNNGKSSHLVRREKETFWRILIRACARLWSKSTTRYSWIS